MSNSIELWYDDTSNLEHDLITNAASSEYGNWKIVSVCDDNLKTGLYAVAIETGDYTHNGVDNSMMLAVS